MTKTKIKTNKYYFQILPHRESRGGQPDGADGDKFRGGDADQLHIGAGWEVRL